MNRLSQWHPFRLEMKTKEIFLKTPKQVNFFAQSISEQKPIYFFLNHFFADFFPGSLINVGYWFHVRNLVHSSKWWKPNSDRKLRGFHHFLSCLALPTPIAINSFADKTFVRWFLCEQSTLWLFAGINSIILNLLIYAAVINECIAQITVRFFPLTMNHRIDQFKVWYQYGIFVDGQTAIGFAFHFTLQTGKRQKPNWNAQFIATKSIGAFYRNDFSGMSVPGHFMHVITLSPTLNALKIVRISVLGCVYNLR